MNLREEYKAAKINYECLGMMNTPIDPIEAVEASIEYQKAQVRYYNAKDKLIDSFKEPS